MARKKKLLTTKRLARKNASNIVDLMYQTERNTDAVAEFRKQLSIIEMDLIRLDANILFIKEYLNY